MRAPSGRVNSLGYALGQGYKARVLQLRRAVEAGEAVSWGWGGCTDE